MKSPGWMLLKHESEARKANEMRKTKAQSEADGKDKLRQRIMDIAYGAMHGNNFESDFVFYGWMTSEAFSGFIKSVEQVFPSEISATYSGWYLYEFANLDSTVEHLWECGVRA